MRAQSVLWMLGEQLGTEGRPVVTRIEPLKLLNRRLSFIMYCRIITDDGRDRLAWAKILNPSVNPEIKQRRVARDFDLNNHLYGAIDTTGQFRVPEPVYHSPEHRLVVTGHIAGTVLQTKIESHALGFTSARDIRGLEYDCRLAGGWLRSFQALTEGYCPGQESGIELMKVKGAGRIVEQTIDRLRQLVDEDPRLLEPALVSEITYFLNTNLADHRSGEEAVCSIHGDFFAGNLMVDGETIAGLDFESTTWGSPLFDPGYFVFQLETLQEKLRYKNSIVSHLVDAFLNGYGIDTDHKQFWDYRPELRIIFLSLAISRLLSLSANRRWTSARGIYRHMIARNLIKRLKSHIRFHQGP
ncbi:phosphotransferase family enzyme [Thiohalophilus thiocyanatoxydans]|uniref:Phosphotransferase family enzyme n=1 Tax=Thiohalophilus thiocyanatoxydans TaxID=381308 RepID=A0A4R8IKR1_9GAMM|nr:phosphotransferase family enzyme [Thiohalophilus thiocyanatoxydans]